MIASIRRFHSTIRASPLRCYFPPSLELQSPPLRQSQSPYHNAPPKQHQPNPSNIRRSHNSNQRQITQQQQQQQEAATATSMSHNQNNGTNVNVALVTIESMESAETLSRDLLEKRLCACVNIVPKVTSLYIWEGKIQRDEEYLMIIKTHKENNEELTEFVKRHHKNDVAETIFLPITEGNEEYLAWVCDVSSIFFKEKQ